MRNEDEFVAAAIRLAVLARRANDAGFIDPAPVNLERAARALAAGDVRGCANAFSMILGRGIISQIASGRDVGGVPAGVVLEDAWALIKGQVPPARPVMIGSDAAAARALIETPETPEDRDLAVVSSIGDALTLIRNEVEALSSRHRNRLVSLPAGSDEAFSHDAGYVIGMTLSPDPDAPVLVTLGMVGGDEPRGRTATFPIGDIPDLSGRHPLRDAFLVDGMVLTAEEVAAGRRDEPSPA